MSIGPRTYLCAKCGKFHTLVCEKSLFGRAAKDTRIAELERQRDLLAQHATDAINTELAELRELVEERERVGLKALADLRLAREGLNAIEGYDIDWTKGTGENVNAVAELARRTLAQLDAPQEKP